MKPRALRILVLCLVALAALPVAHAAAARSSAFPTIAKIVPMRAGIGDSMVIRGRNFVPGKTRNTVVFKRDGKPAIFARAERATRTKLTLVIPAKLERFLAVDGTGAKPTKFRVRILSRRFGKRFTTLKASPVIGPRGSASGPGGPGPAPADCDRDGTIDALDPHDDADQLPDVFEEQIKTDRCLTDTDGDGMEDGWEYRSAVDLNTQSCPDPDGYSTPCVPARPYPGKRPYPNPLDPGDAKIDHDGDWLPGELEHLAWVRRPGHDISSLWYSGGLQASQDADRTDGCRGLKPGTPPLGAPTFPASPPPAWYLTYSLDRGGAFGAGGRGDGCLSDDERDEDGDQLTNMEESAGELSSGTWWEAAYKEPAFPVPYAGTNWLDADSDGDGVLDGLDDQDNDDFTNLSELERGAQSANKNAALSDRTGLWVNPFNPCLPAIKSRSCPAYLPVSDDPWRPFTRPDVDEPVKPRWPLYRDALYTTIHGPELWTGKGVGQPQPLPPEQLLDPRPYG